MKIRIIGVSGTGKTYFARKLSDKLKIKYFELDNLQWENSSDIYGVKRNTEKRNTLFQEILKEKIWIMEGVYYKWCMESFKQADIIYILELPRKIYRFNIIKRFIKRKFKMEKGKKETLKSLKELLKWTDKFQKENFEDIKSIVKNYEEKTVFIKSYKEMKNILENIKNENTEL
ncbi:AAA family ATPase [Leptotrichia sp. OH3620_COT-345]|uniref:AAA family ATPase n=1 Tax=Leptotrichia sp. OH3620_COT-345 TaxID=2491048 RepID=UPI000F648AD5|nr:AAA family ATPase [Leptotrichia sp. OH3620_COT-345]RRD39311.1 AAA family ATPase [Leptotrichia sp. OH3620_COT-345]